MSSLQISIFLLVLSQRASSHCIDIHSQVVAQGLHYVPGPNTCTLCICDKGSPKWCKSVLCKPPENCKSFQIGNSCCEFKCLDDILTNEGYKDTYDLALRLIASAFTALLSLSILFLLYHRLRRRKIRLRQTRPSSEDQRSLNSIGYITGGFGYHPASYGYLGSGSNDLEYPYEPNTQFSLWKPPGNYFPRGEAPPPYEEAVRLSQLEHDSATNSVVPPTTPSVSNSNQVSTLTYSISTAHPATTQPQYQNGCCVLLTRNEGASNETNKEHYNAQTSSAANPQTSSDKVHSASRSEHHTSNPKKFNNSTRPSTSEGSKQKSKSFENICERERGGNQASMPTSSDAKNHIYANQKIDPVLHRQKFEEDSQRIAAAAAAASSTLIRRYVTKDNRHRTISKTFQNKSKVPMVNAVETVVMEPKRISMSQLTRDISNHRTLPANLKEISIPCSSEQLPDRSVRELSLYKDHQIERPPIKDATIYKNQLPEVSTNRELSIYREKTSERPSSSKDSSSAKHGYKKDSDTNCKTLTKSSNWSTIYIPSSSKTPILDKICQLKESIPSTAVETKDIKQYYKSHIPEAESSYQCLTSSQDDDEDYRKSAAEAHQLLVEAYGEGALSERTCREWFQKFKNGDFDVEDKDRSGRPKIYEDAVLEEDSSQTQKELALTLEVTQQAVSHRLKSLGMIHKQGNWVPSECENCKFAGIAEGEEEIPETMTLQRRPLELEEELSYYRTSLTLPTHSKKPSRILSAKPERESWFLTMDEYSSSDDSA